MNDSSIRKEKVADSKISGYMYVWTGPYMYFILLYLAVLKCVIRYFEIMKMNRFWLTQIFLYRFYEAQIYIRLGSGIDYTVH